MKYTFGPRKQNWRDHGHGRYTKQTRSWAVVCPAGYIVAEVITRKGAAALCALLNGDKDG